jgi:insertion element IS1 protein InsB
MDELFTFVGAKKSPPISSPSSKGRRAGSSRTRSAERTPEVMQSVIDSAPHASRYFSDAFNTYRELCWWGEHASMYDKSQTYSVEGDNAELRHYLVRLTRRSRCFSKCIHALRRAVELFVWCWNQRQTYK